MGRRRNNPELVQELIDGRWTMPQDEFEKKYDSLSSGDKDRVAAVIDGMGSEWMIDDDSKDDEGLSVYDAAEIWESSGRDDEYMFGYTEEELEGAL